MIADAQIDEASAGTKPINHLYQGEWPTGDYCFFQIAWIVDDLHAAMEKWHRVYGVGPFHVMPKRSHTVRYRGKEMPLEMQLAVTQAGPVEIELIQQTSEGMSVYREIFPNASGGMHHLCAITKDFDRTKAHYESLGYPSICEFVGGALRVEYFDTFADFGHITELVGHDEQFMLHHAKIDRTCATWNGVDPIRLLAKDGYRTPEQA